MSFELKWASIEQIEDELAVNIKSAGHEDIGITRQRFQLQLLYRECIIEFPTESHAENVDAALWRHCFHAPIDYYRKFFRGSKATPEGRWAIAEVNRLIDSGLAFFSRLLFDLMSLGGMKQNEGVDISRLNELFAILGFPHPNFASDHLIPGLASICYRLIIYCGDLARYRGQFNKTFQNDQQSMSEKLYRIAHLFEPDHGHACNQIAVISSMLKDVLSTIFWYLRAECCVFPFVAARDNLLAFLGKKLETSMDQWQGLVLWIKFFLTRTTTADNDIKCIKEWTKTNITDMKQGKGAILLMIFCCLASIDNVDSSELPLLIDSIAGPYYRQVNLGHDTTISCKDNDNNNHHDGENHANHQENILLLLTALALLKNFSLKESRHMILEWIQSMQNLTLKAVDFKILEPLYGFDLFDAFELPKLETTGDGLLKTLLSKGLTIDGIKLKNNVIIISHTTIISTPKDASSPLVLFAPPTSSQRDSQPPTSDTDSDDEIVVFRGLHPDESINEMLLYDDIDSSIF